MTRTRLETKKPAGVNWMMFSPDNLSMIDDNAWLWDVPSGEGRRIASRGTAYMVDLTDGKIVIVTLGSIDVIADDLPREPAALAELLARLPYKLDNKRALVVQAKSRR
jgi:hypothetical protein